MTYEIICKLPAHTALKRIEAALSKEGVEYTTTDLTVTSVRTPIVVLGLQPKLYSHSNWVGLNPFAFVSGIDVRLEQSEGGSSKVTIRVNRRRGVIWVGFWITCASCVTRVIPAPEGIILLLGITCVAWFGMLSFLGGYLIKKEIIDGLSDRL